MVITEPGTTTRRLLSRMTSVLHLAPRALASMYLLSLILPNFIISPTINRLQWMIGEMQQYSHACFHTLCLPDASASARLFQPPPTEASNERASPCRRQ
jgi:hypothetical protein